MKARNFAYAKAGSLDHAIALLAQHEGGAVPLAGGQSLLAGLNLRLSAPEALIDITGLADLRGISIADGKVRIGALTRHVELARSDIVRAHLPLIAEAIKWVAHAGIRNRGTIGGSVAYADPSAELPACLVTLDATLVLQGPQGRREVKAPNFFDGLFSTTLQPAELITDILVPLPPSGARWAFLELSRRRGDFAMAGVAMTAEIDASGAAGTVKAVFFGCTDFPTLAQATAAQIGGHMLSAINIEALADAVASDLELVDTPGYRAATKLRHAQVLAARAVRHMAGSPQLFTGSDDQAKGGE